jgi:hypothetical protein
MSDQLTAYVHSLEAQVKSLNGIIADLNTELCARELNLERSTAANDDFQRQSTQLTKKLEGVCPLLCLEPLLCTKLILHLFCSN